MKGLMNKDIWKMFFGDADRVKYGRNGGVESDEMAKEMVGKIYDNMRPPLKITKPHETPKDRFEKLVGEIEKPKIRGSTVIDTWENASKSTLWNYHTTELKAVLESLRMDEVRGVILESSKERAIDYFRKLGKNEGYNKAVNKINQKIDNILKEYE